MADENKKILVEIDYKSRGAEEAVKQAAAMQRAALRLSEYLIKATAQSENRLKEIKERSAADKAKIEAQLAAKVKQILVEGQNIQAKSEARIKELRERGAQDRLKIGERAMAQTLSNNQKEEAAKARTEARLTEIKEKALARRQQLETSAEARLAQIREAASKKQELEAQKQADRIATIQARAAARPQRTPGGGGGGFLGIDMGGVLAGLKVNPAVAIAGGILVGVTKGLADAGSFVLNTFKNWGMALLENLRDAIVFAADYIADIERTFTALSSQGQTEILNANPGMSTADATAQARIEAAKYLEVLREIAIYSPFSETDVREIYRTLQAYGLARNEATRLTQVLADYAAGAGRNAGELQSLTLALAQIAGQGRVTGEELRQLSNAGLPLENVAARMGVTVAQLREMSREGTATSAVVLPALIAELQKFEGAARRAAETNFTGVLSSLRDIGPILLSDFFGPINAETGKMEGLFGALIPVLNNVVGILTSADFRQAVQQVGRDLGEMATKAFSWGYNLMVQYGNGILAAAAVVIRAIAQVGRIIASWLAPQSPPKILPNIDDWGRETMEVWLAGFTQADAGEVFGTLSDRLGGLFTSLFKKVVGPDADIQPQLLALRGQIGGLIEGFAGGGDTTGMRSAIASQFGDASLLVDAYIRDLLAAQSAQSAVAKAQIAVNQENEKYQKILDGIDSELETISRRQSQLDDANEIRKLNLILGSQYTTAQRKERARLRLQEIGAIDRRKQVEDEKKLAVGAAEEKLRQAELEDQKAKERLALSELQLQYYKQEQDLLNQQEKALSKIADALEKLGKVTAGGGAGGGAGAAAGLLDLNNLLGGMPKSQPIKLENIFAPWKEGLDDVRSAWDEFKAAFNPSELGARWDTFATNFRTSYENTIGYALKVFGKDLQVIGQRWEQTFTAAGLDFDSFVAGVLAAIVPGGRFPVSWDTFNAGLVIAWQLSVNQVSMAFRFMMGSLANTAQFWLEVIQGDFSGAFQALKELVSDALTDIGVDVDSLMAGLPTLATAALEAIHQAINGVLRGIESAVNEAVKALNQLPGVNFPFIDIIEIPSLSIPYTPPGSPGGGGVKTNTTNNITNNYNLTTNTSTTAPAVINRFNSLKAAQI